MMQTLVLIGIVTAAFFVLRFEDILASVISLAIMSLLLSLEFYILQAPDVAMAEAAVGAGLSTAVYVIAIKKSTRYER
jgi:energy-converting hydrogenase B subunit D